LALVVLVFPQAEQKIMATMVKIQVLARYM
jgi:hypothetical protein